MYPQYKNNTIKKLISKHGLILKFCAEDFSIPFLENTIQLTTTNKFPIFVPKASSARRKASKSRT
jgi:hypothetical protein